MSTREKIASYIEDALFLDPAHIFDDAIIGIAERAGGLGVVAYDRAICIERLMADGMDRDEAEEFFEFKTIGAWVGDMTPVFIDSRWAE